MSKFRWTLPKTLEFLTARRPGLDIRKSFVRQLALFENRLLREASGPLSTTWTELSQGSCDPLESEEVLLRNTYLNALKGPPSGYMFGPPVLKRT